MTPPLAACDRMVEAPVDVVWDLVSTSDGLTRWMAVAAEVRLEPGGQIRWRHDNGWVVAGEVLEVVPHRLLRFTFGWEEGGFPVPVGSSEVRIELESLGPRTRVRVVHADLAEDMTAPHTEGWAMFLARLAETVEEGSG